MRLEDTDSNSGTFPTRRNAGVSTLSVDDRGIQFPREQLFQPDNRRASNAGKNVGHLRIDVVELCRHDHHSLEGGTVSGATRSV